MIIELESNRHSETPSEISSASGPPRRRAFSIEVLVMGSHFQIFLVTYQNVSTGR